MHAYYSGHNTILTNNVGPWNYSQDVLLGEYCTIVQPQPNTDCVVLRLFAGLAQEHLC